MAQAGLPLAGGASAGGLKAFEAFYSGPSGNGKPGIALVVVQPRVPQHTSILTDLIKRYTDLRVVEVKEGVSYAESRRAAPASKPLPPLSVMTGSLALPLSA